MKINIYSLVRTRKMGGHLIHNVIESATHARDVLDTMDELFEQKIPARVERQGLVLQGMEWVNDNRFEFRVHRMEDGVVTYWRTEVYELVHSEVEVA